MTASSDVTEVQFDVPENQNPQLHACGNSEVVITELCLQCCCTCPYITPIHYTQWKCSWHFFHRFFFFVMVGWPCILNCICTINQHDALFVLTLLNNHTSTCFRSICGPSSGGSNCMCGEGYFFHGWRWTWPANRPLRRKTSTICHTYTCYLLMMGYNWAQNMYRHGGSSISANKLCILLVYYTELGVCAY
jgi:hypothetical protein